MDKKDKKDKKDEFSKVIDLDGLYYKLKLKLNKTNISISCDALIDYISLYEYSTELSFDKFLTLGKCFKSCSNLDDVFCLLKNIIKGIKLGVIKDEYSDEYNKYKDDIYEAKYSSINLISKEGKPLTLNLWAPLIHGKFESIEIEFNQKEKNAKELYSRLRKKYLNIKRLAEQTSSIKDIRKEMNEA